ncbi:ferritin-like domain-containing protein [Natrinema longum]|uniref:Ferritin-like domain-containing protein n=1 Tax=Natrinema longum TaxID=370324 RepID=A0A8A2UCX7_9EURY|nr:ferritin-like domain-containing protein [Natrinema longum]MBZ6495356.1 ferritin-like domain-containing protein [Natrinema longum]QSW86671.1 ferritin-like domain-containing protein [Natrinema longum]
MTNDNSDRFDLGRRPVLGGLAGALATGAVGTAAASGDGDHDGTTDEAPQDQPAETPPDAVPDEFGSDVEILNYALTLEYLEAEFYTRGIRNIDEAALERQFEEWGPIQDRVLNRLRVVRDHEITHVEVLGRTVEAVGGEPVQSPEFDFGTAVQDPAEFIATAATLEDIGVSAYAGAAPYIDTFELVAPALSIHSVEARHASFLRELNGEIGFPAAFDDPRSKSEVLELASGFIVD